MPFPPLAPYWAQFLHGVLKGHWGEYSHTGLESKGGKLRFCSSPWSCLGSTRVFFASSSVEQTPKSLSAGEVLDTRRELGNFADDSWDFLFHDHDPLSLCTPCALSPLSWTVSLSPLCSEQQSFSWSPCWWRLYLDEVESFFSIRRLRSLTSNKKNIP